MERFKLERVTYDFGGLSHLLNKLKNAQKNSPGKFPRANMHTKNIQKKIHVHCAFWDESVTAK